MVGALAQADNLSVLLVITGMGGVGKTVLAVQAGHLMEDRFPDGQLYVALRGHDPGSALTSVEALGQLLRSLGVRHDAIPDGIDEMARLYRSRMAGRRMLVLLDDASSVDQVTPLLPGGNGSAAVITSRHFLSTLPGSRIVRLSTFSTSESLRLLSRVAGELRVNSEEAAAQTLSELTGGLPLALRLIGARMIARPNWPLQHFVDQLQDEHRRLDELGLGHSGVRATFASSLNELLISPRVADREAAVAFDLLSLVEGPEISADLVSRLLDVELRTAEGRLERLVDMHLLDSVSPQRYRMHDLLRAFADERLSTSERGAERRSAIERGLRYYLAAAWQAHHITYPSSPRQPSEELDLTGLPAFGNQVDALSWLDREYDSIVGLYKLASVLPGLAPRFGPSLALGLFGYLEIRSHYLRMRDIFDLALASGRPSDDLVTWGWLEHDRAVPDVEQGHLELARERLLRSLDHFEAAHHVPGIARCCSTLSHVCERLDQLDEAIEWGEHGLKLAHEAGDLDVLGTNHLALGVLYNRVGRTVEAAAAFKASFDLAEAAGNVRSLARRHRLVATSYLAAGSRDQGIEHLNVAIRLYNDLDDPSGLALAYLFLSRAEVDGRNYQQAERTAQEGLRLAKLHDDTYCQGWLLVNLAAIQDATARPTAARQARLQAIAIFEADGMTAVANGLRKGQAVTENAVGGR
ncbi:hypothetical protein GCM10009554_06530 [Kribbella koreensis]|uniref:NB-ARC domain-containing protein n=1 Tax=Kribbella koreensis TaxID=57909 RepID=A0ABN1PEH0_9ACTN